MQKIKELYFSSKGRISRKSFIFGILGLMAIGFILIALLFFIIGVNGQNLQNSPKTALLGILFIDVLMIVLLVANVNLHIKRFHDMDKSGWWALTIFLPYINSLVALIIAFIQGTQGRNRFGDNPIETPVKEDEEQIEKIDDSKEDETAENADTPQITETSSLFATEPSEIEKLAILLEKNGKVEVICNGEKVLCKDMYELKKVFDAKVIDLEDLNCNKEAQYKKAISFEEWKESQSKEVENV